MPNCGGIYCINNIFIIIIIASIKMILQLHGNCLTLQWHAMPLKHRFKNPLYAFCEYH